MQPPSFLIFNQFYIQTVHLCQEFQFAPVICHFVSIHLPSLSFLVTICLPQSSHLAFICLTCMVYIGHRVLTAPIFLHHHNCAYHPSHHRHPQCQPSKSSWHPGKQTYYLHPQPILPSNCSPLSRISICTSDLPFCFHFSTIVVLPCRHLCSTIQSSCIHLFNTHGVPWP